MRVLKEAYNLIQTVKDLRNRDNTAVEKTKERKNNRKSYKEVMAKLTPEEFKEVLVKGADYLFAKPLYFRDIDKDVKVFVYLGESDDGKARLGVTKKDFFRYSYEDFKSSVVQGKLDINKLTQIVKSNTDRFGGLTNNVIISSILEGDKE